jgi:hypothetical protein
MTQLLINLTGTINSTNFDEWRTDLIAQIQSVNQDLVTDNDFDTASRHVKSFKTAENALKNAKQSAINQAQEIQQLFASIDEITEEARQARLSLERQIRSRKSEIKEEHIQSGIEVIKAVIEEQSEDFKNGDLSHFLDRGRYESAVFGKGGIRGLEIGIKGITSIIKAEIAELSRHINNNKAKLDSISVGYKALFHDYSQLVCLPEEQLEAEIDKRIAHYESEIKQRINEKIVKEEYIQSGIDEIRTVIEEQSEDFKGGDLSHFIDRSRYESAVHGKVSIRELEICIKEITSIIKVEITEQLQHINNNKVKLDSLSEGYKVLFQDYSRLVCLPEEQLEAEIDKRIARYESEIKQRVNENLASENKPDNIQDHDEIEPKQIGDEDFASENKPDHIQDNSEIESTQIDDEIISKKIKYKIAIQMEATPDEANRIVDNINNDFSYYITALELSQNDNLNDKPKKVHMKEDAIASCSSHTPSHSTASKNEKSYSVDDIRKEHNNAYKEWSESDDELLKRLYSEGVCIDDLSKKLGRLQGGIRSRLVKLELL